MFFVEQGWGETYEQQNNCIVVAEFANISYVEDIIELVKMKIESLMLYEDMIEGDKKRYDDLRNDIGIDPERT